MKNWKAALAFSVAAGFVGFVGGGVWGYGAAAEEYTKQCERQMVICGCPLDKR